MDGTPPHTNSSSNNSGRGGPVTPGSVGAHDSGSSPHHSEVDNNSGDSARWRKLNHHPSSTPWGEPATNTPVSVNETTFTFCTSNVILIM